MLVYQCNSSLIHHTHTGFMTTGRTDIRVKWTVRRTEDETVAWVDGCLTEIEVYRLVNRLLNLKQLKDDRLLVKLIY